MTPIASLWLPLLLSSVAVFIASSVIHMVTPWHKSDYGKVANEDALMDALRPVAPPAGDYMLPMPKTREEWKTPEFAEKMKKGPVVVMTVMPAGPMDMGRNMGLWFVYIVVVNFFGALVTSQVSHPGANTHRVFHFCAITAFIGYTFALWQMFIWYRRSLVTTIKSTIDGFLYALIVGVTFAYFWPK